MADIEQLLGVFNQLVDQGNTVIIIEHNSEVMVAADWLIDMGPGAGQKGGNIVFEGHPHEIVFCKESITGRYLSNSVLRVF